MDVVTERAQIADLQNQLAVQDAMIQKADTNRKAMREEVTKRRQEAAHALAAAKRAEDKEKMASVLAKFDTLAANPAWSQTIENLNQHEDHADAHLNDAMQNSGVLTQHTLNQATAEDAAAALDSEFLPAKA